jgi:hypothetical protein
METGLNPRRGVSQISGKKWDLKVKGVKIRPEVFGVSELAKNRSDISIYNKIQNLVKSRKRLGVEDPQFPKIQICSMKLSKWPGGNQLNLVPFSYLWSC